MDKIVLLVLLYSQFSVVFSDKYEILPRIYDMDDYVVCVEKNGLYCKADVILRNNGHEDNIMWKLIKESMTDKYSHDRSVIHRAICIPRNETNNLESIRISIETNINKQLSGTDLLSHVEATTCLWKINLSSYDICFLLLLVMYISLVLYATMYDKWNRKERCKPGNKENKMLMSLSLISNWEKLSKINESEDYNRLKSIQGIRFYFMLSVIFIHTFLNYILIYLSNPEEIVKLFKNEIIKHVANIQLFSVQPFFLISSWIATFHMYNIYKEHSEFTLKHALILSINRYFRVWVCSIVMIFFLKTSWYRLLDGPILFDVNSMIQTACKHNWWQTFFCLSNLLYFGDQCDPLMWYLSVDFQLYVIAVFVIYIILRFRLNEWKVITSLFVLSYVIYGSAIYINDTDIFFRPSIKLFRKHIVFYSLPGKILYTSIYSSWITSVIGIGIGILYTKNKNRDFSKNRALSIIWMITVVGLFSAVALILKNESRGITAAFLGPLVKALFALWIGITILGMSWNIGGVIKWACEHRYVLLISNFSFSIYIFQMLVVFSRGMGSTAMLEFNFTKMLILLVFINIPLCVFVGIIGALVFEQPGINLQKIFLPQIPRRKQLSHKD